MAQVDPPRNAFAFNATAPALRGGASATTLCVAWLALAGCSPHLQLPGGDSQSPGVDGSGGNFAAQPTPDMSQHPDPTQPQPATTPPSVPPKPAKPTPTTPPTTMPPPAVLPTAPGAPAFHARLEGDTIFLDVDFDVASPVYHMTCNGDFALEKESNAAWSVLHDDRPPSSNSPGYYLDGVFVPASQNGGCDVVTCKPFEQSQSIYIATAYEYFKTGSQAPPAGSTGSPALVDVIETRPLSGVVRVDIAYAHDNRCSGLSFTNATLTIPMPNQGVCCAIGAAPCSGNGPGGGWAPSIDACKPFAIDFAGRYVKQNDARGCPTLVPDRSSCCCDEVDAGN